MLDAATELLRETNFDAITVGMIAERSGVPAPTAAELFTSTNDVNVEICLRRIHRVAVSTDAAHGLPAEPTNGSASRSID
jgi:AcrR family transcriptional regulator